MQDLLNRLFRVERGEWPKLLQFGLFGLLLQTGMGIGFAAGDAAFLTHVGPDKLPVIFLLTPAVMLVYTAIFSFLLVRFSIDHVVDVTLAALIGGGAILWALIQIGPPEPFQTGLYYVLKLYLAMWYIALYSLFWNFTDAYFDIQDAKRLFPLFAAFCALGTTIGALIVSLFAAVLPMHAFLLVWAAVALATAPVALLLRRRWQRIADSDADLDGDDTGVLRQLGQVARAFRTSPYAVTLVLTLFVTLLMTNLAEYQYSTVLQAGRSEAELAALFGRLYAGASIFNLVVCLFVFNRLVTRVGVRNVALILPVTYFAVFAYFFLAGGTTAALAAFFAYHGVLTSIEYNNQNLLFNATPSQVKRPFRTVVEGLCEPLASLLAGGFLLLAAKNADMRELSGIGVLLGATLIVVVVALRHYYPAAMEANMRRGWLNFGDPDLHAPQFDAAATDLLRRKAGEADSGAAAAARALLHRRGGRRTTYDIGGEPEASQATEDFAAKLSDPSPTVRKYALQALTSVVGPGDIGLVGPLVRNLPAMDRASRATILNLLAAIGDVEAIPQVLAAAAQLSPRELRATEAMLADLGEAAIPRLMQALANYRTPYRARAVAARALSTLSHAQFVSQLDRLVREELDETARRLAVAERLAADADRSPALRLLAETYRQRIAESVDFTLELLALGGLLPDFDLLIVSLHSANPKVRANAVEAIASGVDAATWGRLEPLVSGKAAAGTGAGELIALLTAAVADDHGFEAVAAAQALRDLVPPDELAAAVRPGLKPDLPPLFRDSFASLLGLEAAARPTAVDLVEAVRATPDFAAASIDAQTALAARATPEPAGRKPVELRLGDRSYWIARADIEEAATRYPDLALTMLKARDDRAYAA
ncbi:MULTISPECIES: translocase [unclassified Phenylobacterium]|uniref:translocase n=1 Tax=unclassified Phenylobacterium TaxID=2640670 RepID=UPI00083A86AC|nr:MULTISPECIES: translocase [unclassified Phenylobacterium]